MKQTSYLQARRSMAKRKTIDLLVCSGSWENEFKCYYWSFSSLLGVPTLPDSKQNIINSPTNERVEEYVMMLQERFNIFLNFSRVWSRKVKKLWYRWYRLLLWCVYICKLSACSSKLPDNALFSSPVTRLAWVLPCTLESFEIKWVKWYYRASYIFCNATSHKLSA